MEEIVDPQVYRYVSPSLVSIWQHHVWALQNAKSFTSGLYIRPLQDDAFVPLSRSMQLDLRKANNSGNTEDVKEGKAKGKKATKVAKKKQNTEKPPKKTGPAKKISKDTAAKEASPENSVTEQKPKRKAEQLVSKEQQEQYKKFLGLFWDSCMTKGAISSGQFWKVNNCLNLNLPLLFFLFSQCCPQIVLPQDFLQNIAVFFGALLDTSPNGRFGQTGGQEASLVHHHGHALGFSRQDPVGQLCGCLSQNPIEHKICN